jgi:hypothetical protein
MGNKLSQHALNPFYKLGSLAPLASIRNNTNIHIEEKTPILDFVDLQNMDRSYERCIRKFLLLGTRK